MSKNIDDDVINNFLYMLEDSKKPITQVKVKKNLPPIPRSYEPKSDGIHLKVIKRYKLYDEFAKPYDLTNKGFPLGKETGTPYSMSDGYKSVALVDRVFENEKEAMQFMRRIVMEKASEKVR